jgi:hypothetical protein
MRVAYSFFISSRLSCAVSGSVNATQKVNAGWRLMDTPLPVRTKSLGLIPRDTILLLSNLLDQHVSWGGGVGFHPPLMALMRRLASHRPVVGKTS